MWIAAGSPASSRRCRPSGRDCGQSESDRRWRHRPDELEPVEQPSAAAAGADARPDADEIFRSIGEVPYEWRLDSDVLRWGPNAGGVLGISDPAAIASGRGFAQLVDPKSGPTRFDAVMRSTRPDEGSGVALSGRSMRCARPPASQVLLWIEDTGRWFAGPDGKPLRAHGVVRVINERHEREQRLAYLSRFDALTGEMNRWHMTEVLEAAVEEAVKLRSSCGFLLVAIDNLGRINEAYGFDVADEVIAAVAKRVRSQLRGKDHLGRLSGNKFGIILKNCTPDDMLIAADRLLAGVRDEVVQTGGRCGRGDRDDRRRHRAAPCPQCARNPLARAGCARQRQGQAPRLVSGLSAESGTRGAAPRQRARDRRDHHRAQCAAHLPGLRADGRHRLAPAGVLRMPDAGQARRRDAAGGERGGAGGRAARPRAPARSSRARAHLAGADRGAGPARRA